MGSGVVKKLINSNNSVLDRVKGLEDDRNRLLESLQATFEKSDSMLKQLAEIMSAVVAIVGPEEVTAAIDSARKTAREEAIVKAKAVLDGLVADGTVVAALAVGQPSLVVGHETLPDGTDSGRLQFLFSDLADDRKAALLGKAPGEVISFPSGSSFKVTEIYDVVEKAPMTEAEEMAEATV